MKTKTFSVSINVNGHVIRDQITLPADYSNQSDVRATAAARYNVGPNAVFNIIEV